MRTGTLAMVAFATCLLAACSVPEKERNGQRSMPSYGATPDSNRAVTTVIAEARYYVNQVPPKMTWGAEIYGDEAVLEVFGTNVEGVVFEVIAPQEYAGLVYTLKHHLCPTNRVFELGSSYQLQVSKADIGKFTFMGHRVPVRKLPPHEAAKHQKLRPGTVIDDLEWLVGRWRCNAREWLVPWDGGTLGFACEDNLDYFNVYFPYADEHLTLELKDGPARPIAAEFLARVAVADFWKGKEPFREYLSPMQPMGPVRIGKNRIRVGQGFEQYEFEYYLREGRWGRHILVLRSPSMQLELYKLTDYPGDIKDSRVDAPIRDFTPEQISDLKKKYEDMKRAHQEGRPIGSVQLPTASSSPSPIEAGQ